MVKYKRGGSFDESITTAPLLRSNFASNFNGPKVVLPNWRFCNIPIRFLVCADPAIAIARSKAIWPFIAVAMVRRKNFRSLKTNFFFGIGSRDAFDVGDWRSVDEPCVLRSVVLAAWDFLRRIGHAGPLSSDTGAGGSGEELISPMRRRVKVNCALVGTPANSVLFSQSESNDTCGGVHILLDIHLVLPVWKFGVEQVECVGEDWITEEAKSDSKSNELDDPITRCEWYKDGDQSEYASNLKPRCNQEERWCGRKQAFNSLAIRCDNFCPESTHLANFS